MCCPTQASLQSWLAAALCSENYQDKRDASSIEVGLLLATFYQQQHWEILSKDSLIWWNVETLQTAIVKQRAHSTDLVTSSVTWEHRPAMLHLKHWNQMWLLSISSDWLWLIFLQIDDRSWILHMSCLVEPLKSTPAAHVGSFSHTGVAIWCPPNAWECPWTEEGQQTKKQTHTHTHTQQQEHAEPNLRSGITRQASEKIRHVENNAQPTQLPQALANGIGP